MDLKIIFWLFSISIVHGGLVERKFDLTIVHNNDMHGRFEQTDVNTNTCTRDLVVQNLCFGGFARTAHLIKKIRTEQENPVIYLNAGDTFTGTSWFQVFKETIASEFLNYLEPEAITLGNHEFDFGPKTLKKFIEKLKFPVVVSNLNLTAVPDIEALPNLKKSLIISTKDGLKVGVIGYVLPDTMSQSSTEGIIILPEIEAINQESKLLREQNVSIIVAVGHSGFDFDKMVAKECPDVDLVIGGHTNTFLYSQAPPSIEKPEDLYPVVITQESGRKVLVVQAFAYTKYLGILHLKFDENGEIKSWMGSPILLDHSIPQDQGVIDMLETFRPNITALGVVIGHIKSYINGTKAACRKGECNFGNLITNSYILAAKNEQQYRNEDEDTFIALVQTGGIKLSLDNSSTDNAITLAELVTAYPYKNDMYIAQIRGNLIRDALERSAFFYHEEENGGYLQFAGLEVTFNMTNSLGERVIKVMVETAPRYFEPLREDRTYNVVSNKFLLKGGDGYKWGDDDIISKSYALSTNDFDAIVDYMKQYDHYLDLGLEGRQIILH